MNRAFGNIVHIHAKLGQDNVQVSEILKCHFCL